MDHPPRPKPIEFVFRLLSGDLELLQDEDATAAAAGSLVQAVEGWRFSSSPNDPTGLREVLDLA